MKNNLLKIFNHFGIDEQQKKLNEEVFELQKNIFNSKVDLVTHEELVDEIADVLVLLKQFQHSFEIKTEELEKRVKYKVNRTMLRIENKYYEKNIDFLE